MSNIKLINNRITILEFIDNCHSENYTMMVLFQMLSESFE